MEELDIATVTKRSIRGVFALVSRSFVMQIISLSASFLLTIYLSPSVFGVFFLVSAVIAFLSYFSDIGLAAALIQKKEPITDEELKTTFTMQQLLVGVIVILALFLSNPIASFYRLDQSGVSLFQALVIAFFLSSLKTIPSIILERNLHFEKLVIPQIVETLVFNLTALFLAIKGYGITSFTFAVLARGIFGLIAIYIISPWKIGFGFSTVSAKRLLSFGIPFQTNSFLALIKDDLLTIYLGKILPIAQVGYIGFAQKWGFMPLRLIMDNVIRITFPSFSRLSRDKDSLTKAINKSLFATTFFVFPALAGLVILAPYLVELIPKYGKWQPALLSLSLFAINASFSSISTSLTNALNAIGKIRVTLFLMIFWTVATWILTPISIMFLGYNGVAGASAVIACSVFLVIFIAKRYIKFDVLASIISQLTSSLIMGVILFLLSSVIIKNFAGLIFIVIIGVILYLGMMFLLGRNQILSNINMIRRNLKE